MRELALARVAELEMPAEELVELAEAAAEG